MKLLRIDKGSLGKLAEANAQVRNIILVPCCYRGFVGIFVSYDDMVNPSNVFLTQQDALVDFDPKDIVECTVDELDNNSSVHDLGFR